MTDSLGRLGAALAGRYVVERELGSGGMATVYLAHDVRHDRKVALKVLRPELSAILGAERFLTEIKTTANLQHPHILSLFDSGEAEGTVFYVMPYVEGESLRDRIAREKQLPVEEAVRIAREVADALDYAHRHGVVHRDIKPENILLHDSRALVADFGIALAVSRSDGGTRMTETGMSLGTPHYMSPEQAMGQREITPKADVYALGCVLYEMLTGEPPFTGPTAQAIVARVMTEQPRSLTLQRHTIPPHVEATVQKALEKLPADRFATAAQFSEALAGLLTVVPTTRAMPAATWRGPDWRSRVAIPALLLAAAGVGVAAWSLLRPHPAEPVIRYGLALPSGQQPGPNFPFRLSPDGARLVYVGPTAEGSGFQLWLKERDRHDAVPIPGTGGVVNFTFSPDGQWIAFEQGRQLKKLAVSGGAAITLADSVSTSATGIAWLDDGTIVFVQFGTGVLRRVAESGGPVTDAWRPDTGVANFPTPLPDSRGVLVVKCRGSMCRVQQDLWVVDLQRGEARELIRGATIGLHAASGHLVYVRRDGATLAAPFDLGSLELRGAPVPMLDSVSVVQGMYPLITLSRNGTLVVRTGAVASSIRHTMVWVDRSGAETPVDPAWAFQLTSFGGNAGWALSPDGTRLAISLFTNAGDDIWVKLLPRGPLSRVTYDSAAEYRPRWLPDGRSIGFMSNRSPSSDLFTRNADGTGSDSVALDLPAGIYEGAWSRDGRWVLARTGGVLGQVGARDIVALHVGVDSAPSVAVASPVFDEAAFALSPDARWLAYESNETGRTEVYIRPFPTTDASKTQVSTERGLAPLWSRDGRELFFVNGNREMVVRTVAPGPELRLGEPRVLFPLHPDLYLDDPENYTPYDISADGRRFIMAKLIREARPTATQMVVAEHWFTELRERVRR
jgi:serine/threonine-protein kinase